MSLKTVSEDPSGVNSSEQFCCVVMDVFGNVRTCCIPRFDGLADAIWADKRLPYEAQNILNQSLMGRFGDHLPLVVIRDVHPCPPIGTAGLKKRRH